MLARVWGFGGTGRSGTLATSRLMACLWVSFRRRLWKEVRVRKTGPGSVDIQGQGVWQSEELRLLLHMQKAPYHSNMEEGSKFTRTSRVNLVDLAGSEQQILTDTAGDRLKEARNINHSLSQV
uniref:Kinesin motor domain-containing protein n=1 Tax=Leersia perrieri TaxID=77586 RepID=A0A0D9VGX1_9ORYZ